MNNNEKHLHIHGVDLKCLFRYRKRNDITV